MIGRILCLLGFHKTRLHVSRRWFVCQRPDCGATFWSFWC